MLFFASQKKILREGSWVLLGQITAIIATAISARCISEFVPARIFGQVSLLLGIIYFAASIFASPFAIASQRFHCEALENNQIPLLRQITNGYTKRVAYIFSAIIIFGGISLSIYYQSFHSLFISILVVLYLNLLTKRNYEINLFTGARRQKEVALFSALESILKPLLAISAVALISISVESYFAGYCAALIIIFGAFHFFRVHFEGNSEYVNSNESSTLQKEIRRFAFPIIPICFVSWVISLSDRYIIANQIGVPEAGIFGFYYGLISMPLLAAESVICGTLRPIYYQKVSSGNRGLARKLIVYKLTLSMMAGVCVMLAVFFFKDLIIKLFIANEYQTGIKLMPWLALGISLQIVSQVLDEILRAHKKTGLLLLTYTVGAIACLTTVYIGTKTYGIIGAAMACPVYFTTMLFCNIISISTLKSKQNKLTT